MAGNQKRTTGKHASLSDLGTGILLGIGYGFMFGLLFFPKMPIIGSIFGIAIGLVIASMINISRGKEQ